MHLCTYTNILVTDLLIISKPQITKLETAWKLLYTMEATVIVESILSLIKYCGMSLT